MSLRRRVMLGCVAVVLVLVTADFALANTFRGFLLAQVDEQLAESAGGLVAAALRADPAFGPRGSPGPGAGGESDGGPLSEFYLGLAAPDGTILGRFNTPLREDLAPPQISVSQVRASVTRRGAPLRPFTASSADGDRWRLVALRAGEPGGGIVLVGASLDGADATHRRMVIVLVAATVVVVATLIAAAWWVLRQGVRPLAAMTATAEAIAGGALHERVEDTDERTEAGRLGAALNTMLVRIETAFAQRSASEERLRRFVADASHELRTPLTSIRGYAELYRAGGLADAANLAGAMRRVEQEAARMSLLVEDLLLLAKLDQGRPLETHPVDLAELVSDAVADLQAVDPDRPVTLNTSPVIVPGDDARLRQAVANLLSNVRAHTPSSAPLDVTVASAGGHAVIDVMDKGPGMPPDVAARVFERFYRADTSRSRRASDRSGQGTGLGLAIVAGIAETHGGRVTLDSAEGQGSRFRLLLPLDSQTSTAATQPGAFTGNPQPPPSSS